MATWTDIVSVEQFEVARLLLDCGMVKQHITGTIIQLFENVPENGTFVLSDARRTSIQIRDGVASALSGQEGLKMQIYAYYPTCWTCYARGFEQCGGHATLGAGAWTWTREHAENVLNHMRDTETYTKLILMNDNIVLREEGENQ